MKYLKNVVTLQLDREKCVGCGRCLEVCPHGVFSLVGDKTMIVDRDACMECGACARNCPVGALYVKNGVGCAVGILNARLGRTSSCCGEKQACCCSSGNSSVIKTNKKGKTMSEQNDDVRNQAGTCGPGCGCNCGTQAGCGKKVKWMVFGAVMLAACAVIMERASASKEASPNQKEKGFALPSAGVSAVAPAAAAEWVSLKKGMAELNVVATNTEAVFVVIPSDDAARTATIQKEVLAAVATIKGRGTETGTFVLAKEAEDYKAVSQQIGAPSVLAMVKGRGMGVVADKDVSKDALLKAFVSASRPRSGCGCGPGGCN